MSYTGNFSGSCKTRGVLFAVFCLSLNSRERERERERERKRETNRSGWSHVAGSRNAYSYWIRGINKRACLYSRYFFCCEYMIVRERDGLIAGSRNACYYGIRGQYKRACLYSRYFFCSEYRAVRERDGSIAGSM
jgi:hypothetical protein